jgi:Ni/Fe-hydrogenase subunit HybB-like protein
MADVTRSETHPEVADYRQVNRDILRLLSKPGPVYFLLVAVLVVILIIGFIAFMIQVVDGMGRAGLLNPVGWGVYIATFVFWVGIAHSGTLISAILYLFRARWRQSIYRAAEAMTVFAVMTAGLFPIIHLGRPWIFYYLLPYPNERMLWPNFRGPLLWDVFAVGTYFTVSATFFYVGMLPDLAAARDSATVPWRRRLYSVLSLGWRGTDREWKNFTRAYLYLAGLATPLVLSVHSVVSWDFAMSIVPGWHTTIFAPYFVAGAIFSGLAMVITLLVPMRKVFDLRHYFTVHHFDMMARLILLTSLIVSYAYIVEYFMAWYSWEPPERHVFLQRLIGNYWWATWIMITCNMFIPQLLWWRSIRTSIPALFVISIFINIGMWFERFVIIVTSLASEYVPWQWETYQPSWIEMSILLASFAWFLLWFLIFIRVLPAVSVAELKEVLPAPLRVDRRRLRPQKAEVDVPSADQPGSGEVESP